MESFKRTRTRSSTKERKSFIVSVREDVLDDIGLPFMCLDSSIFPDPKEERYNIKDAIYDIQKTNENMSSCMNLDIL